MHLFRRTILFFIVLSIITSTIFAQAPRFWQYGNSYNGIPLRQGYHIEWARAGALDADGNFCFVWSDCRLQERDVYAQKYAPDGTRLWDEGGKLVVHASVRQEDPDIFSDGYGGFLIGWIDYRADSLGDVRAQRLDAQGNLLWDSEGVPVCVIPNARVNEYSLHTMPDGDGGGIFVWHDNRSLDGGDIYAQHILPDGTVDSRWPVNGKMVAGGPGMQGIAGHQSVDTDSAGGIWVAYDEARAGGDHNDIRLQHVATDGTLMFPDTMGLAICTDPDIQHRVKLCPDGVGGAFMVWVDKRNLGLNSEDLYIQRVDASGSTIFQADGMPFVTQLNIQEFPRIVYDGIGGAIVAWLDNRNDPFNTIADVYAQRVDTSGNISWAPEDVLVCGAVDIQRGARLNADGNGGAVVVWTDERNESGGGDIYAQRLLPGGTVDWAVNGIAVCDEKYTQSAPLVRTLNSAVSMVVWLDERFGSPGLFNQLLDANGVAQLTAGGEQIVWGLDGDAAHSRFLSLTPPPDERILVVWQDRRRGNFGNLLFQQLIDITGQSYFPFNGKPVSIKYDGLDSLLSGGQEKPELCNDGAGGAIVCWEDWRTINDNYQIYAQRLDGGGDMLWDSVGVRIFPATGVQYDPEICIDGLGGAFIAWHGTDSISGTERPFVAHIDGNGNTLATSLMPDFSTEDKTYAIVPDGSGGAIMVWEAFSLVTFVDYYIYVARVDANCDTLWVRAVCDTTGDRHFPVMRGLNDGGVIVVWEDRRNQIDYNIYAQKVDLNGNCLWERNGIAVTDTVGDQTMGDVVQAPNGEILIVWKDMRRPLNIDLYLQKLDGATGAYLFQSQGIPVSVENNDQTNPVIITEDSSGFHICWEDYRGLHSDVYASHFAADGNLQQNWTGEGDVICDFYNLQETPVMTSDFHGGAIAVWPDARSSGKEYVYNLYAQRWNDSTITGVGIPRIKPVESFNLAQNHPNPFNPETVISFSLAQSGEVKLVIYNALGREVARLVDGPLQTGYHRVTWSGTDSRGFKAASGIYYYRLEMEGEMKVMKMIMLK